LTYCNGTSTSLGGFPGKTTENGATLGLGGGPGKVMLGNPVTGTWTAVTTGNVGTGGFNFNAAPKTGGGGIRTTGVVGDIQNLFPYIYSYTYATFRHGGGSFAPSAGPGNFTISYTMGGQRPKNDGKGDAQIYVKQGQAKFGGTMRMLGAITTKVCYFRNGACSLGENNWRYDAAGTSAYTSGSVVTAGYLATYKAYYYHTGLMQKSTVNVEGARFPWTTGSVTLKATGRGPHKTVHYTHGYDNRTATTGKGTIQLVTPLLTRWIQTGVKFETGGVGILRIKLVPEPQTWAMLVAGVLLLGVGNRMRGR
jgi:hypothetical protein